MQQDNFSVYENGVLQTDLFEVVPPGGGGEQLADFIFVLDVTGSMSGEIESVRENMTAFMDSLAASDIQYAVGFIVFGDIYYTYNEGDLYTDPAEIQSIIDNIQLGEHGIGSGGDYSENQLGAMAEGVFMNYRPGAQRIEIMLTDATAHENDEVTPWEVNELIGVLQFNNITVYPIFNTGHAGQCSQYIPIAEATNGDYYYIYDIFNEILNDIVGGISGLYTVRYRSSEPEDDGRLRYVTAQVEFMGEMTQVYTTYVPNQAPVIQRTARTLALHDQAWPAGEDIVMRVRVVDAQEPYVTTVRLYYRTTGDPEFFEGHMLLIYGDETEGIYRASIPASFAQPPGVDYYFRASDGYAVGSDPMVNPTDLAYQLAILPNEAPVIVHQPVLQYDINSSITVEATITDVSDYLTETTLYYREYGNQLYQAIPMIDTGSDLFSADIPAVAASELGVQYYIFAEDNYAVGSTHGTPDDPHFISPSTVPRPDLFGIQVDGMINGAPTFSDLNNIALFDINGTDGMDMFLDRPDSEPDNEDFFAMWFIHRPSWHWPYWRVDCRSSELGDPAQAIFNFLVASDQIGETARLEFGIGTQYPDEWQAYVRDMENGQLINLRSQNGYEFVLEGAGRHFRLYCGIDVVTTIESGFETPSVMPDNFSIASIQPNPFNPSTTITLNLPMAADVRLNIYNITGQLVTTLVDAKVPEGRQHFVFDANTLASGIYFAHVDMPGHMNEVRKLILVR